MLLYLKQLPDHVSYLFRVTSLDNNVNNCMEYDMFISLVYGLIIIWLLKAASIMLEFSVASWFIISRLWMTILKNTSI